MSAGEVRSRLETVERRFAGHVPRGVPETLTDPDPASGERWDAGQVWAHAAEFPGYWVGEVRKVVAGWVPGGEPVPFGRVKADPDRVAAIERDRAVPVEALERRVRDGIEAVRALVAELPGEAWAAEGVHSTLGVMPVGRIVEEFLVGHLEEHADQLDTLKVDTSS